MKIDIVIGAGFGDEGKGAFVNHLCSTNIKTMVVRFNGGHQVGHTVVDGDKRHVFSNFGSGTLQGTPTYWSKYCTVSPTGVLREGNALRKMGVKPVIYFDANAMVTTPFDILQNRINEGTARHGSVGVGFGQTVQRNEDHYHLYMRDLLYPEIRDAKIKNIIKYYGFDFDPAKPHQHERTRELYNAFIHACDDLVDRFEILHSGLKGFYDHRFVFEGGQGIMLDMDYGFFPNVTRSNCTSKNALELIKTLLPNEYHGGIHTYYMTRAYQCRHGMGHMSNEDLDTSYIIENPIETNVKAEFQGEFRKSVLDLDMLQYAINCDKYEHHGGSKTLVVTCLDQVPARLPVTTGGKLIEVDWENIATRIDPMIETIGTWSDEGYNCADTDCIKGI